MTLATLLPACWAHIGFVTYRFYLDAAKMWESSRWFRRRRGFLDLRGSDFCEPSGCFQCCFFFRFSFFFNS